MNTTQLIRHWNMSGADGDVAGRFRSQIETREELGARSHQSDPALENSSLLVKGAGDNDWIPLGQD